MRRALPLLLALALLVPAVGSAATITIVNIDGAGEGFNDPTPATPVGGNPGTTIGDQRLFVFQYAADIWGDLLPSAVEILIQARFNPQTCDATSAVLGSAGPIEVFRDFPGAPLAATWYHVALANKLRGADLSGGTNDISITFNSSIDNNDNCLAGTNWYYGVDGLEGPDVELLPVVLHEMGHGLGFSTLVNGTTGSELQNYQDRFETYIRDNTLGLTWDQMSNPQRANSATNTGNLVWSGPATTLHSPDFLGGAPKLFINSPGTLPATMDIGLASFGAEITEAGVTGDVVLGDDGSGSPTEGCSALVNAGAIAGNIALLDRGSCTFVSKALNAQNAGAIALIIANNTTGSAPGLGGTDPSITIPVISVSQSDGDLLKAELGGGVNVTIGLDPLDLAGADNSNRVQLYAPNPFEGGSSVSHFDIEANPNLLMEPAINDNLSDEVDLTLAHFVDIGWRNGCVDGVCPPDTSTDEGVGLGLTFGAVNCGPTVDLTVTVTDTEGWITPVNTTTSVDALDTLDVPVTVTPDTCNTFTEVVLTVSTLGYPAVACTTRVDANCTGVTGIGDGLAASGLRLAPIQPTPFRSSAEIRYALPAADRVSIDVFDIRGRQVRTLAAGEIRAACTQSVTWDGRDDHGTPVARGIYFVRLTTDTQGTVTRRTVRLTR